MNATNDTGSATGPGPVPGGHGPAAATAAGTGAAAAPGPGENPAAGAPAISLHAPAPAGPAGGPRGASPGGGTGPAPAGANRTLGRGVSTGLWGRVEQQDFRSRVRGALLGSALGDALGAPAAGLSLAALREAHGPDGLTGPAPAFGRRGRVTAATQLTLFTVDGLIRAHVRRDTGAWHPPTDLHRAYLRWAATQHDWGPDERRKDNGWLAQEEWLYARRAPHRACLSGFADEVLGTLDQPKNPAARDAAAACRSAPFGLLVGWEPTLVLQLSVECAAQSHGHPTATLSAGAVAVIVHGLIRGDSLDSAVQRALGLLGARPGHQPVTDALQRALAAVTQGSPGPEAVAALAPDEAEDGTDATDALAAAVYCALVAEDVAQGLRLAVNHGGDSIAAGALCGALLGALHGETALPAAWLAELEGRAALLELADDFALEMTQGPSLHSPTASTPGWLARYPRG
ncbi:ADP-ribosylglycohydrolase family protein [Streptomyces xanthophaeus]|uniref:ADP-ribosylglycohydrolase family protein n=1 Tax=Streptomyces xanthophaeus TaxID=67385 RepID=UPI002649526D|nr:ADP-ribosylglycohydrolase family protein [Streptomyces xanthophaeus]